MPRENVQAIYVGGPKDSPTLISICPTVTDYTRLFGHAGLHVRLLLHPMHSAYGEMLYSVSDGRFRLPSNRKVTLPTGGNYLIHGPFLIVGATHRQDISLSSSRITYWMEQLKFKPTN